MYVYVCSMSSANAGASAGASLSGPTSLAFVSGIFPSFADEDGGAPPLPELAEDVDPTYLCSSCREVLRQPKQTPCGHRICTPCVGLLTQKFDTERFRCPADEEECVDMTVDEVSRYIHILPYIFIIEIVH